MGWKGKLNKIDDLRWEIPKEYKSEMRVPTRIYANTELLEEMKGDRTFEQGANVSSLQGIYKYSAVLPDGHQGYGFPIGGVAATDAEEGVISPGGVGYDINCLPEGAEVLTSEGYRVNIDEVSVGDEVTVLNSSLARPTEVLLTLDRDDSVLYEIKTKAGFELSASPDHPILTRKGMKESKDLSEGREVGIHPFRGVEYEEPNNFEIVSDDRFRVQIKNELEKRELLPLNTKNEKLPQLLKIFGYLLGDGTVYDKYAVFYGDRKNLEEIKEDIQALGYKAKIYERDRNHEIEGKKFSRKEISLKVSARSFTELMWAVGYPKEDKTETDVRIPQWVFKLPKWMKRLFLASYFGAEMSKPKTMNGYNFYMPEIKFSRKKIGGVQKCEFLEQLQKMLEDFDIDSTISISKETEEKIIYRLLVKGNSENLLKLWENIGYEYNRKRRRLAMVAIVFLRLKRAIIRERESLREEIRGEKDKLPAKDIIEKYEDTVNKRFIERSLYSQVHKARPPKGFIKFEEYFEEFSEGEIVYDEIREIKKAEHEDRVYDFTVKNEHHNFVANGFVVSNCGVRLLKTNLDKPDVDSKINDLVELLFKNIPSGVGSKSKIKLSVSELDGVLEGGSRWAVENGYGWDKDVERIEENGCLEQADSSTVSSKSKNRGKSQVGSLGSGNHFLEVQYVDEIFDRDVANKFGISHEGQVMAMIHTGSRGFGHQVCTDNLRKMEKAAKEYNIKLPDRELVNVPINSNEGQDYLTQMACAANFAWANRQMLTYFARGSFSDFFSCDAEELGLGVVYDVAHNIAKFEEHRINGSREEVCVHRKGATRAFPPGHSEIPGEYRGVGQPVLIPGNMGTASYVLVGTEQGGEETFSSTAHGAGRRMSRTGAKKKFWGGDVKDELWDEHGIYVRANHGSVIAEEAPGAYKDVDSVVKVSDEVGIGSLVARLRPLGVAKG